MKSMDARSSNELQWLHSKIRQKGSSSIDGNQGDTSYRKISNRRRTKSQNFNDSDLVLQSSLPNPLKPGVKSRMKI